MIKRIYRGYPIPQMLMAEVAADVPMSEIPASEIPASEIPVSEMPAKEESLADALSLARAYALQESLLGQETRPGQEELPGTEMPEQMTQDDGISEKNESQTYSREKIQITDSENLVKEAAETSGANEVAGLEAGSRTDTSSVMDAAADTGVMSELNESAETNTVSGLNESAETNAVSGMNEATEANAALKTSTEKVGEEPAARTLIQEIEGVPLMPYMLYRRENQTAQADVPTAARRRLMEQEYFVGLYPQSVRRRQRLVEEMVDHIDHNASFLYDEYPDRSDVYRTRDQICRECSARGMEEDRDMTQVLLVDELSRRRMQKG